MEWHNYSLVNFKLFIYKTFKYNFIFKGMSSFLKFIFFQTHDSVKIIQENTQSNLLLLLFVLMLNWGLNFMI